MHRYTFGDTDDKIQLCVYRFIDCCSSKFWWHVNDRYITPSLFTCFDHTVKDWNIFETLASLPWGNSRYKTIAPNCVVKTHPRVELASFPSNSLGYHTTTTVDQYGHCVIFLLLRPPFSPHRPSWSLPDMKDRNQKGFFGLFQHLSLQVESPKEV